MKRLVNLEKSVIYADKTSNLSACIEKIKVFIKKHASQCEIDKKTVNSLSHLKSSPENLLKFIDCLQNISPLGKTVKVYAKQGDKIKIEYVELKKPKKTVKKAVFSYTLIS